MAEFIKAVRLDRHPPGLGSAFTGDGRTVACFNVDGAVHAIDDTCPRAGGSLGTSKLDGKIVTGRAHGMNFDVTTGCFAGSSGYGVVVYSVKVVNGKIMVAV